MDGVLKVVPVDFEKAEKMFVEPDSFVVVTVEQAFAMELRLIDQAPKVNVAAELFVRTARMQSSHDKVIRSRAMAALRRSELLPRISSQRLLVPATVLLG